MRVRYSPYTSVLCALQQSGYVTGRSKYLTLAHILVAEQSRPKQSLAPYVRTGCGWCNATGTFALHAIHSPISMISTPSPSSSSATPFKVSGAGGRSDVVVFVLVRARASAGWWLKSFVIAPRFSLENLRLQRNNQRNQKAY